MTDSTKLTSEAIEELALAAEDRLAEDAGLAETTESAEDWELTLAAESAEDASSPG